jgi:threonine dehydrogenase-like Zn-dependent dehydrogenase
MPALLDMILSGGIDPSFLITHNLDLSDAPEAYKLFQEKKDSCIKVIMKNH